MTTYQGSIKQSVPTHGTIGNLFSPLGFGLAIGAGLSAVLSGFGTRLGWWHFTTGFAILKIAAGGGVAAAVVSLVGGIFTGREHHRRALLLASLGIILGLVTAGIPWSWMRTAEKMPVIHDITTDPADPPQFVKIMPLRKDASNSAVYGGSIVAAKQQTAYPDIRPLVLPLPPDQAFNEALRTAKNMGWKIVDSSARDGRIEAMATTFWFGFTDDVVVRVTAAPGGSRIDVRSESRVGSSDLGTNAKRVSAFLNKMGTGTNTDSVGSVGY